MIKADIFLQTNCMPLIVHSFIRKALPTTNARLCRTSYENSFKISLQSYQFDLWPNPCAISGGNYPKRAVAFQGEIVSKWVLAVHDIYALCHHRMPKHRGPLDFISAGVSHERTPLSKSCDLFGVSQILRIFGCLSRGSWRSTLNNDHAVVAFCNDDNTWLRSANCSVLAGTLTRHDHLNDFPDTFKLDFFLLDW